MFIIICMYGHVHLSLGILVNKNNSVFDDRGLILASIGGGGGQFNKRREHNWRANCLVSSFIRTKF